ncbi:LysM peptidoglycan-binding domain-containing protein [Bacillus sp. NPDC077027]|uniref:LysM peptidoglycan-binding domain-containing protein n=1 Tax=Bacillus sp. NPDC077027 TaxID=3390548 RepID=UPI003D08960F
MEEMSRIKRKKQQLTKLHDDIEDNRREQEVETSDDSTFPSREDFHDYKKQRTKKVRNPLFTTLAIIFPIIVIGVFFILIYYTTEEINNNNQGVYIDHSTSADTDPVKSALAETKNEAVSEKKIAKAEKKQAAEEKAKEKKRAKEKAEQKKADKEKQQREKAAAEKKQEEVRLAALKKREEEQKQAEKKKEEEKKYTRVVKHTVGPKETLYRISMKYYQNRSGEEKIRAYNNLRDNSVYSGQVLNIPLEN